MGNDNGMGNDSSIDTGGARVMKASEFKAKCLKLMDEVAETGEEIVITKRGRPVARLRPLQRTREAPFGRDRDIIRVHGDIDAPLEAGG